MSDWNPTLYGTFLDWRTRPSRDLARRLSDISPRRIVDLGCGPGNSTAICAELWPGAAILGLDSSPEMIATARAAHPDRHWMVALRAAIASLSGAAGWNPKERVPGWNIILDNRRPGGEAARVSEVFQ
jgi:trans-aconitate 2-methyltransferase